MSTEPSLRRRLEDAVARDGAPSSDFDLNRNIALPEGRVLRPAGVLLGLQMQQGNAVVLLTKRASHLKHHPGQIAFPGGKVDEQDGGPVEAALREANEEIGLPTDAADVIGTLPAHETVTGFSVTPVLALIEREFEIVPEAGEVAEVFSVPFEFLMDRANFSTQSRRWRGQRRSFYTVPWGPYYIWGATARMLLALADRMEP